ncbi:MAG: ATP-binding protein [Clostridium sp.]
MKVVESGTNEVIPSQESIESNFLAALDVVDEIVLKSYITNLKDLDVIPLDKSLFDEDLSEKVRFFKITRMVYEKDEYSTYKFASVFNSLASIDCSVFVIVDSDGEKSEFYMGVRSLSQDRTTNSIIETLKSSMKGQFPGIKTKEYIDNEMEELVDKIEGNRIAAVSCVANSKDSENRKDNSFIQGLEKLANAMKGEKYTGIVLANSISQNQVNEIRRGYENIYTQLSPFESSQVSYATNSSTNISASNTYGITRGTSYTTNSSIAKNESYSSSEGYNTSESKENTGSKVCKILGGATSVLGVALAPFTAGASMIPSVVVGGALNTIGTAIQTTKTEGRSSNQTTSNGVTSTSGESSGINESISASDTRSEGSQEGTSHNITRTIENKVISSILNKIDIQIDRLKDFESHGVWECAAYFLSDNGYTADVAATTYKSLMKGEDSGVEVSAINSWSVVEDNKSEIIKEYVTNFMHPVFRYNKLEGDMMVTPCSIVSSNELAIHMGLPRRSVCGLPVIEHSDFGKEVVSYSGVDTNNSINLGNIFNMGSECDSKVRLDRNSLAMHTFVTGSTGSGKSNTIYQIIRQLDIVDIPFMIIEPAKGEYKNVFGNRSDVKVLGTNPQYSELLKINPFKFPPSIHVLEHIDRLIEIFNVCWPMYAAMPAVLKDAVLQSYEVCGWDLVESKNIYSDNMFPTFGDLQIELVKVIEDSAYSQELKSNYIGSLVTRIKSLTNGLNGQIFSSDETNNVELFDNNVVVDLSRIGSMETKSLIMGILIMRLNEHRVSYSEGMNLPLRHVTVLEEAHNILKKSSSSQGGEGGSVAEKSVEMLANTIAEIRTYGEGFIIVDQSPGAIDISAIRNTNTKIIMRLPEESDRRLAGKAAGLKDEQLDEIAKLPKGVAVVYQNDWLEPVLCKVKKFEGKEQPYKYTDKVQSKSINTKLFKGEVVKLLLAKRISSKIEANVDLISESIGYVELPTRTKMAICCILDEYRNARGIGIWSELRFNELSEIVTEFISDKPTIDKIIRREKNFVNLNTSLKRIIDNQVDNIDNEVKVAIAQCFMKEFSKSNDSGLEVYAAWRNDILERKVM